MSLKKNRKRCFWRYNTSWNKIALYLYPEMLEIEINLDHLFSILFYPGQIDREGVFSI